ncbi:NUDIX domain-containing protein [Niabella yanshanensis]|uniref:NUDIX domain-containing protein n=1 Tax=Niabella yanshanensis TaxID=577386 RepID=A0ABZ0W589_9BACT|nr:NUDIX domain-containing protein [Niabella yanshanensis]WQD38423.1 NUDIX domain-containing protein [Niabella yanshanensis]
MNTSLQILPAVAAIVFNDAGEVLLQKRRDVDQWGIISGHVEFGETVEEAIKREIKEETNSKAIILRLIGVYSSPASQTYRYGDRTVQYVTSYFEAIIEEKIDLDFFNQETAALEFFNIDNMPVDMAQINPYWLSDALSKEQKVFLR